MHLTGWDVVLWIHLLAMALFLLGSLFLRAPWLYGELRFHPQVTRYGRAAPVVAGAAFAFGWLPAGRPEPDAVPFYRAAGYTAGPDIADFYAEGSVANGAVCPYCGDPPCRCAVRPFVKDLAPA